MTTLLRYAAICLLCLPGVALASGGYGYGSKSGLSRGTTSSVVRAIERGIKDCTRLDTVYRYDCYRVSYGRAASKLSGNPAYAEAEAALRKVERTLATVVASNADATAPKVRKRGQSFQPIKSTATAAAKRQFRTALDEAETVLLRSGSGDTKSHFASIAQAVNSNKILLRALLVPVLQRAVQVVAT